MYDPQGGNQVILVVTLWITTQQLD